MNTSATTHGLSKPAGDERIPSGVIDYINTRNRLQLFDVVQNEFVQSSITKVELAHRMGRAPAQICHLLGAPGNWTADTASSLIFAISGGVLNYSVSYPLNEAPRNLRTPEWLGSGANTTIGTVTSGWTATEGSQAPANFGTGTTVTGTSPNNFVMPANSQIPNADVA